MAETDISSLHILVVDDDIIIRDLTRRILEELGAFRISSAENGYDALVVLEKAQPKVDVILLDLEMPRMSGFEFIKRLKSELLPPLSNTPVIVISGHSEKESLDRAHELGVSLFLLKPITPEQLTTRIKAALRHKHI